MMISKVNRRASLIAEQIAGLFSPGESLLEIGAGKGLVALALREATQVNIELVEVVDYNQTDLHLQLYDGKHLPFSDASFDYSLLVFVLHHTPDPAELLAEALRVVRHGVIVVENHVEGWWRKPLTRWVDSIPHFQYGVPVCYHTLTVPEWQQVFERFPVRAEIATRFTMDGFWHNFVARLEKAGWQDKDSPLAEASP